MASYVRTSLVKHKACVSVGHLRDDVAQPLRLDEVELLELKRRIVEVQ